LARKDIISLPESVLPSQLQEAVMRRNYDPSTIFMNSTLVAKITKNKLEEIRVSVLKNNKIDVRTYFYFPNETDPKPTKKGAWLSFRHIPPIISAMEKYLKDPKLEFALEFDVTDRDKEKIRVYVSDYMNSKLVHIRIFYLKGAEYNPGKGISFAASLIPQILETFRQLEKYKQ
jgi:hypothetical protein